MQLSILQLSSIILVLSLDTRGLSAAQWDHLFDAIYQFGDSLSDTGNGIRENRTSGLCTSFPYGESFFHYATGRCSDGLIMADYYARAFGLPFLNPYLDEDADFSNGVDFSVAGAHALDVDVLESKNIKVRGKPSPLSMQLGWFKHHLNSICSSTAECKNKLRRSLFLMETIGGDDYNLAFGEGQSFQFVSEFVPDVVRAIINSVKELIQLGAIHVLVPSLVPFGCMPNYLASVNSTDPTMYDELGCLKPFNEFAEFHNHKLRNATEEIQMLYPNATIIFADYYYAIRLVIRNAASLGFEESTVLTACCGSGQNPYNFNSSELCGKLGVPFCPNPKQRVSWDGRHFTQQLYKYVSEWMLINTIIPQLTHTSSI